MTSKFWNVVSSILALSFLCSLSYAGVLRGVVYNHQGKPVASAQLVFLNSETNKETAVKTNDKGVYRIRLPHGEYEIYRIRRTGRLFFQTVAIEGDEVIPLSLRVPVVDDQRAQQSPRDEATSLEAIREYQLRVSGASASETQSLADLINPFPARKQRRFNGSIYEFHRNDNLDARNFFDPLGEPLPEYKRNQFGLALSFIVTPNMTLNGSFDGYRIIQGSTLLSPLPTLEMKNGDFAALDNEIIDGLTGLPFPNNQIPSDRIDPISSRLLPLLPDPNREDEKRNYVNNQPVIRDQDSYSIRFDYTPEEKSKLLLSYYSTSSEDVRIGDIPGFDSIRTTEVHSAAASYNRSFTDQVIGNLRLDYRRTSTLGLSENSGSVGLLQSLGIEGLGPVSDIEEGYPSFSISGYTSFGDRNSPDTAVRNTISMEGYLTYVLNSHTFRVGVEIDGRQLNNDRDDGLLRGLFYFSGAYTGDAFADFLLGWPDIASRGIGSDRADLRAHWYEFFFRDGWKVTRDFSLSYGIQYNYYRPYQSVKDNVSGFYPLLFEPPLAGEIVIAGTDRASELGFDRAPDHTLIFPDRNDWAPSIGFGFNPFGTNQFVIRGSYSIWYDSPSDSYFADALTRNYPFYYTERVEGHPTVPDITFETPFAGANEPELTFNGVEPSLRTAYLSYWRLTAQGRFGKDWFVEATYTGYKGSNLIRRIPANVPLPGSGATQDRRPNPDYGRFSIVTDGAASRRHELDVSAEKRLSGGLSFRTGFEWGRMIDNRFGSYPSNPRDLNSEWAPSSYSREKSFFLNYIYDLPMGAGRSFLDSANWSRWLVDGWRLSGVTKIISGSRFGPRISGDPNNDGVYGDRPDRIGSGVLDPSERSIDEWFNTSDFQAPEDQYGFGNAGRNILLGPGSHIWDLSVIKTTSLADGHRLEFRVEFFNAFNHVNFDRPNYSFDKKTFGRIFGADRSREIELALKYSF